MIVKVVNRSSVLKEGEKGDGNDRSKIADLLQQVGNTVNRSGTS